MPPEPEAALAREVEVLQASLTADPDDLTTLNNLACCLLGLGQVEEALRLLEGASARWGKDACLANNLGFARLRAGRPAAAEAAFCKALVLTPEDPETLNHLGLARAAQERWPEAVDCARRALEAAPPPPLQSDLLNNLGCAFRDLGTLPEAASVFRRALALSPSEAEIANNLGCTQLALGDLEEARLTLGQAARLAPGDSAIQQNLRRCLERGS